MTSPGTPVVSRRMERGILALFVAAGAILGLGLAAPGVERVVATVADRTPVTLLTSAEVPLRPVDVGPEILSAQYDTAMIVAAGLPMDARILLGLGAAFGALTLAATVATVVYFFLLLMWRRPLHRSLIVASRLAGATLTIGGILSAGLGGLGTMMAASAVNPAADDQFLIGAAFDPGIFFAGIAVLALSFVFDRGAKAQRDTEGLV